MSAHQPSVEPGGISQADPQDHWPLVSVVVAVRNEADFADRCLRSLLRGDYPPDRMEILVVDGMSNDGTRAIVERLAKEDSRIRLLDNPRRIVAAGVNVAIREARGEIITWLGGHAEYAPDFLSCSVRALMEHPEVWCVGGPIRTVAEGWVGRSIAAAMSTPVGVGNAMFRLGNYEGYVDTITFASYRRWVFDRIGLFDEELVRNQDDELNLRLVLAGGKIYMTPQIRSEYYPRTSLRKLARQYFQYGYWRIRTIQKHQRPATLRQIAPLLFVLTWLVLMTATLVWPPAGWGLLAFACLYALGLLAGAMDVARRTGIREALLSPVVFAILHFSYGLGSLKGLVSFVLLRRKPSRPEDHALSR
ncbi:MAG TPA: glycosyltransferase family 2 protein [Phycisphaerae bacterium]|jgi:succinoglycan biosynthesis protein ExoA|nr:glycosyltransferase family 2 protein [Phycisphaerae bacterium]HOB73940.1 glycosyltransferase family 2 protein [Phycisphaerae bacterium]HOJ55328.1 glycosyltransferase family 2 protein [Phycisphaerae bacterium]HOL25081.1 glycosyltransferase family 2 protein [Phycisphaerae bacterium]HPP19743.1 glycosyltransferase family 2 protein [Phycisphaerae bacterium]